jgi:hypothetical protein
MGYRHIENVYRCKDILMFKECWAAEKIDGTSAHVSWNEGQLHFSPGCVKLETFKALFDEEVIKAHFERMGRPKVVVYGEAYGGKVQKRSDRYGKDVKFVAFDVLVGDTWLAVPIAHEFVNSIGLEFVHYVRIPATVEALDAERDAPSEQARRNGVVGDQPREGIVIRPIREMFTSHGEGRVISKHKRDEERETKTVRNINDPVKQAVLEAAEAIAEEWVTETRLDHVLDKFPGGASMSDIPKLIAAMIEDVTREGSGEFVDSKDARKAIGNATAKMFKQRFVASLRAE